MIKMYIWSHCPYCKAAKKKFDEEKIMFRAIEIYGDEKTHNELKQKTGQTTVPYIFVNDEFIGGYEDLKKIKAKNGTLRKAFNIID
jgi:glutaredoxin 3